MSGPAGVHTVSDLMRHYRAALSAGDSALAGGDLDAARAALNSAQDAVDEAQRLLDTLPRSTNYDQLVLDACLLLSYEPESGDPDAEGLTDAGQTIMRYELRSPYEDKIPANPAPPERSIRLHPISRQEAETAVLRARRLWTETQVRACRESLDKARETLDRLGVQARPEPIGCLGALLGMGIG